MIGPSRIKNAYKRLRHRRGHGIHSPFVYSLVRQALMERGKAGKELFEALTAEGFPKKYIHEIGRIYDHLNMGEFSIVNDPYQIEPGTPHRLYIYTACAPLPRPAGKTALCIPLKKENRRYYLREKARGHALSIDRGSYALFFYDPDLPKQHFIL